MSRINLALLLVLRFADRMQQAEVERQEQRLTGTQHGRAVCKDR
jgi:hypothetical protein